MKKHNRLTPAEAERLALLTEEMGEAMQIIGKILRHGYRSINPLVKNSPNNRTLLEQELGDVRDAMLRMCAAGDLDNANIRGRARERSLTAREWLHHQ